MRDILGMNQVSLEVLFLLGKASQQMLWILGHLLMVRKTDAVPTLQDGCLSSPDIKVPKPAVDPTSCYEMKCVGSRQMFPAVPLTYLLSRY